MPPAIPPKGQSGQEDPDTTTRFGGWLFRHRTSIPLPIVLALVIIPPPRSSASLSTPLMLAGVLVAAAGELLRFAGVHHIGVISRTRSERLGPLIDTGPFAHVRNPLYLGNILLWLGFAISARLLWLAPIVVVLLALEYHAIVRWEEQLLESRMGEPYRDYKTRVPRWIPRITPAPSAVAVSPADQASPAAFTWVETLHSERGTLIAIVAGYLLLWAKTMVENGL